MSWIRSLELRGYYGEKFETFPLKMQNNTSACQVANTRPNYKPLLKQGGGIDTQPGF